jgi:hypothetical protein
MRTIYVVCYDWAYDGSEDAGVLGVYEHRDDAIARMDEYWQEERELGYLEGFDKIECDEWHREGWVDWRYFEHHTRVEVREQYLYSREDVANGLA